ncbi:hypothetical protein AB0942_35620 [Streptomyces nodosus]|uniref:hypothetical protein n=1 Tax=Streptomyces nodosus TaxID=40318 RepID=UPI00345598BA
MGIIPEDRLHRMPTDETGRTAYYQPGGILAALAEAAEEATLRTAARDVSRVEKMLKRHHEVTRAELTHALCFLVQSAKAAVDVAECRGERLDTSECGAVDDAPEDSRQHGPCNLPAGHRGRHVNDSCPSWGDA